LGFVCFVSLFLDHRLHDDDDDEMWIFWTAEEEEVVGVLLCFFFLSFLLCLNTTQQATGQDVGRACSLLSGEVPWQLCQGTL
jgi:hypothetical protein